MTVFEQQSVADALERSIANASHLRARHSATIAAARALARKIDAWDQIVAWAVEDAEGARGARPAVPANDNVSLASFLKYLDALGVNPDEVSAVGRGRPVTKPAPAKPAAPSNSVIAFRKKAQSG